MGCHKRQEIRIALLLQDLTFGGTQRQAVELAKGLNSERYSVELWVLMGGEDFVAEAQDSGIPIVWLGRGAYVWPAAQLRLWRRLRSHPVDILLLLTGIPNIWGRIFGLLTRVPVVVGACRDHVLWHERFLGRLVHHHVCNSAAIRNHLTERYGLDQEHMTVIPNGVDLGRFSPPRAERAPKSPVVLHIGRLVRDKDQAMLISAFAMMARDVPDAELWVVGDGPLEARLKRMASESPCADRIRVMPGQADVEALLHRAEIFVLSSRRESLPNVVLESMAFGLPIVATDVGGLSEVVAQGKTGLLVPPSSPAALAEALRKLLADTEKRKAFGQAGRARVEEMLALDRMIKRYEALFEDLLSRRIPSV